MACPQIATILAQMLYNMQPSQTVIQEREGLSGKGKAAAGKLSKSFWLALRCSQLCCRRVVRRQALESPAGSLAAERPDVVGVLCQVLNAGLQPEQGELLQGDLHPHRLQRASDAAEPMRPTRA